MRQMEEEWNFNMAEQFNPSLINLLENIMMEWFKKYLPRSICVGRKTHPFGNERHTLCCDLMYILWRAQTSEGKDRPHHLGQK